MDKKKFIILLSILIISSFILTSCGSETAGGRFNTYKKSWESGDYDKMYSMLSKESKENISKEEFIARYEDIYSGIDAKNLKIERKNEDKEEEEIKFKLSMDTLAGEISLDSYNLSMIEERQDDGKNWFVQWDESLIFPEMEDGDLVKVERLYAERGEIFDKDGNGLAVNGERISVGIFPEEYDESNNEALADLLDIDIEIIQDKLDRNTNPKYFVPIVKIDKEDREMSTKLSEMEGVMQQESKDRLYPGGEAFGNLVGYITPITAEQLEKAEDGTYHNRSKIGKFGLEEVYEEHLKADDGVVIYISRLKDEGGEEKQVLAKVEGEDGEDLNISIDTNLQKNIYEEMQGDEGATVAIDPTTGEVLSMVSYPSFDSNLYTTYVPNSQKEEWEKLESNVFQNKFNKAYSPGSTFKIITSAIGLSTGDIDPDEKINIEGKSWQKDSSWGAYNINRLNQKLSDLDLNDAFVYSDNIYFAKTALKIGEENFIEGSKKFGFHEELPIEFPFARSQIANEEKIDSEILLADTGYGQGQVLMSPLHLSLVYSGLVNNGNIMEPKLIMDKEPKVWKENVMDEEVRIEILNDLVDVIENNDGTGYDAKIDGTKLAGKTGTAELKSSQNDKGNENGWFVSMNVDDPQIVIASMVKGVEDRGGSHYVVPKVRKILEEYLR